ncbi:hypothetical protein [Niabella beijingensis]|uniref:hypothetical protein n=1 Tax=Niabella beijingensis TaxID=2872700 RepID=UPI001CBCDAE3|nr:hypothetical protein [Niabella beijingensis]MBZ4190371.1 hypothetical protein [Niabella beijingensis]
MVRTKKESNTGSVFFRAAVVLLYTCFFLVHFSPRAFSAKEFGHHSFKKITATVKGKTQATTQNGTVASKRLNKRFEVQPLFLLAALILFLLAPLFFVVTRKHRFVAEHLQSITSSSWSQRGPPAGLSSVLF